MGYKVVSAVVCVISVVIFKASRRFINYIFENIGQDEIRSKMQAVLYNVKVSEVDATKVEQQLNHFTKWEEGSEVTRMERIPVEKFPDFLDHLQHMYGESGVTDADRRKWNGIHFAEKWTSKIIEWKFNADTAEASGVQGARYGIIAFAKSSDGKYVDCMLAIYKLDFRLAPKLILKENSVLWGLYVWSTMEKEEIDRSISREEIAKFQNFFRYKALNEFKREGIIDKISYTNRLEYKSNN
ncbi:uncharacterized protein LOC125664676 [Ostrea edulis]|uniref:uncharacterized protein LOC125664676 n=1 Tax=Ostrea edulis TaxID=37623 RepID=UPI0024AEAFB3|nr:uncharacterized protein LOC125664676 [Ostrea edulis]